MEVDYENPWIYKGAPFTSDDIGDYYGFVYRITNTTTQKSYIGRKYFYQKRKPRGGKRRVTSESDWKRYYGSSDDLKQDIREIGKDNFRREIISLHETLGKVNYEETKQLFLHNVLMEALDDGTPMYYNSNILGRYMRKDYGNFEKNSE
jgi:hypothetical protein|tara:strand:+ start:1766 stop:2212 length:447 start_codon:yes stop_codon:yes gene_type:complete